MPVLKIYIHLIWSTKNRVPYLFNETIRSHVWAHMADNAKKKEIQLINVNGHNDHCHCLIRLKADQTIAKILQLLKGESSHWINQSGIILPRFASEKFDWQNDYYAESISPRYLYAVNDYINLQEEHHKKESFKNELDNFLTEYELKNLSISSLSNMD